MKVVRQWMIVTGRMGMGMPLGTLFLCAFLGAMSSCNPTKIEGKTAKSNVIANDGSLDGKAFIFRDSPYILAGPRYSPGRVDIASMMDKSIPELITLNTQLTKNCTMTFFDTYQSEIPNCVRSLSNQENLQALPRKADNTWIFTPGSPEFYQVNMLHHLNIGIDSFFKKVQFAYERLYSLPSSSSIPKSIPPYLKDSQTFWFKGVTNIDNQLFRNGYLNAFSNCNTENNAHFDPVGPELCFGFSPTYSKFFMVQDPSIVYHELGHALVSIMMNMRNATTDSAHALRSNLGSYGYDEAASINEGIADYYSFVINRRTHFAEWGLTHLGGDRPISEVDPMHIEGIDTTPEGRLSYPQFLHYYPVEPELIVEDIHYAGMIASHYLVALTQELMSRCTFSTSDKHDEATSYMLMLLAETLSEIGDLNARGIDNYLFGSPISAVSTYYFNNLDPVNSYLWAQHNNLTTYRKLFQVFAKNVNKYITGTSAIPGLCPQFSKNDSEKLLDDYGLLLFKTYNDNGNSTKDRTKTYSNALASIPLQSLTSVNENNRRKSVLVSKQLLQLAEKSDETPTATSYYIIDGRTEMESLLKDLLFKGFPIPFSNGVASVDYNNSNIRLSPGEVLAVIPNLHNASNSPMGGVHLLATDWDHVHITDQDTGYFKPCVIDTITTADDGGEEGQTCATSYPDKDYARLIQNPVTKKFPVNAAAPVCLVLLEEGDSSRWVSQSEFRKKQGLSLVDKDCLGFQTSGTTDADFTFNPHECLARFIPGGQDAFYSKIDPQKNYYESVVKVSDTKSFSAANILIMEVNKWTPPGTKFRCRLRARFSNCNDCYHDSANSDDDYIDAEYNGHKPFKVINFDFEIND